MRRLAISFSDVWVISLSLLPWSSVCLSFKLSIRLVDYAASWQVAAAEGARSRYATSSFSCVRSGELLAEKTTTLQSGNTGAGYERARHKS